MRSGPNSCGPAGESAPTTREQDSRPGLGCECVIAVGVGAGPWTPPLPPRPKTYTHARTHTTRRLDLFSAWFQGLFRQLSPAAQAGEKVAVCAAGIAPGRRVTPRLCRAELATQNCAPRPPGRPSEADSGRQDPCGVELEGASGSRAPALSPAAQAGIERRRREIGIRKSSFGAGLTRVPTRERGRNPGGRALAGGVG